MRLEYRAQGSLAGGFIELVAAVAVLVDELLRLFDADAVPVGEIADFVLLIARDPLASLDPVMGGCDR